MLTAEREDVTGFVCVLVSYSEFTIWEEYGVNFVNFVTKKVIPNKCFIWTQNYLLGAV